MGKYKSKAVKERLLELFPFFKIESVVDPEVYKDPSNSLYKWPALDLVISTLDDYNMILSLVQRVKSSKDSLIIIDAPRLTVTTHSVFPFIEAEKDLQKYLLRVKEKQQMEEINMKSDMIRFPRYPTQCILWGCQIFTIFFNNFFFYLKEFEQKRLKFVEDLDKRGDELGYDIYIVEIIKFVYFSKVRRGFADCVDLAIAIYMVTRFDQSNYLISTSRR